MSRDLIIVGGGIAGATLAMTMARAGADVLVLEREGRFRDRIRGEAIHVWGTVDARTLGVYDLLMESCAHELDVLTRYRDGAVNVQRDFAATTPSGGKEMTFYHPAMQDVLINAAQEAGVEIWREALVTEVRPGDPPTVLVRHDGTMQELAARLVVGADGRRSKVRAWCGFTTQRDPDYMLIVGVLVSGIPADPSQTHIFSQSGGACMTQFLPFGTGQHRCYVVSGDRQRHVPIGGRAGLGRLREYMLDSKVPQDWIDSMQIDGPLASFEAAAWWVDNPACEGIALIGDAAAAPDPCFGNGLSLALRDARVLSSHLLSDSDWNHAAGAYATEHDAYFTSIHNLERWATEAFYSIEPEKQSIRDHASAAGERGDTPDILGRGPDQPSDEAARLRFLGY